MTSFVGCEGCQRASRANGVRASMPGQTDCLLLLSDQSFVKWINGSPGCMKDSRARAVSGDSCPTSPTTKRCTTSWRSGPFCAWAWTCCPAARRHYMAWLIPAVVERRPGLRFGAACILENIADGVARSMVRNTSEAPFLAPVNSRFIALRLHEAGAPWKAASRGNRRRRAGACAARRSCDRSAAAAVLCLRMLKCVLFPSSVAPLCDPSAAEVAANQVTSSATLKATG